MLLTSFIPASMGATVFSFEDGTLPDVDILKKMTFTREDSKITRSVVNALEKNHYSELRFDDELSSRILDNYLDRLDPARNIFTAKDIADFEKHRHWLDNRLKRGDLLPGYLIFNIYLERSFERLSHIIKCIEKWESYFDFTQNHEIELDRKDAPWPENMDALRTLWEKEIKNTILSLKLDGESNEEITSTLSKRYKSRLNRLIQTDSPDAFKTYINAVAMTFDPHTQFFPPRMSQDFDIQMSLSLEGIGAILQSEYEYTKVVSLIPAGPADKSGQLMPGDKIIGVGQGDGGEFQDTLGWRIDEVVNLIRGPKDTVVRLKIIPAAQKGNRNPRVVSIIRDKVKLEEQAAGKETFTIQREGKDIKIGVITLPTFYLDFKGMQDGSDDYRSTARDVINLLDELRQENIQGLIMDLRDNGGGALQEVNELVGFFIKTGPTVQIKSRRGYISRLEDTDPSIFYQGPLIVMINRMSASASEIFAGAIKDYNRGIVVGTPTFGKGTVQALQSIENGQLKVTTAKFYRISGESTQHAGVSPDIHFPPIYNKEETGESSLKGVLPWDTTVKAPYTPYRSMEPVINELESKHLERISDKADFKYLRERYELSSELYGLKSLPLNMEKRKAHKERMNQLELKMENSLRLARGLAPFSSIEEFHSSLDKKSDALEPAESDNEESDKGENPRDVVDDSMGDNDRRRDILMKETREIMADFIMFAQKNGYAW
ncbi:MAG: carboxy terminal-processing peptidase [Desulfamplus sp.]|nr:carboxy terminal-processing peptidase [Desulfamplus sp.]